MERSGPRGVPKVRSKVQSQSTSVLVAVRVVVVVMVAEAGQPVPGHSPLKVSISSEGWGSLSRSV